MAELLARAQLVTTSRDIQHWTARVQGRIKGEAGAVISFHRGSNRLLGLLPARELNHLATKLQAVQFSPREVLHRAHKPIEYVYFPIRGGCAIEIAPIGNEGLAGLTAVMGSNVSPQDVVVQVPGHGLRIAVSSLQAELKRGAMLQEVISGYHNACAALSAYETACNGLHSVKRRCCRRLLTTQDRLGTDVLPLTHEAMAMTLGVRRATVTEELAALQQEGVIRGQRGQIRIVDRAKLKSLSCECYDTINDASPDCTPSTAAPESDRRGREFWRRSFVQIARDSRQRPSRAPCW